jgi:hypothetical protein
MLVAVDAPHFYAGIVLENDRVVCAAPILRWTLGKNREWLRTYFSGDYVLDTYIWAVYVHGQGVRP